MSDFDPATISHIPQSKLAIFMVSTYGEGEPSDNLGEFWSWIGSTSNQPLAHLTYAAFGLGNSNYKHYNAVVDYVTNRLQYLRAQPLLDAGKADDAQGQTEEHYAEWKSTLFSALQTVLGFEEHEPAYEPGIHVNELLGDDGLRDDVKERRSIFQSWTNRPTSAVHSLPIKIARELFEITGDRSCIHMEVDLSEQPGLKYKTGDHLGVWPSNPAAEVIRLLKCLGREAGSGIALQVRNINRSDKAKVPESTTLDALLTQYLGICPPLSQEEIGSLVQFAPTNSSKILLMSLSKDKSQYEYLLKTTYINLGRLLELAAPGPGAWKDLPLAFIIESLPAMRPRYYSVSSSSVVQPRRVAITAVVADRILPGGALVPGLCTNFLRNQKIAGNETSHEDYSQSCRLIAHIRKSAFKLPALSSHPIIMVAAGTGIAPFRGFLQERARLFEMGRTVGRMILVFGCRNENQDYMYRDELRGLQATLGSNFTILTAFSRPDKGQKTYVQNRFAEHNKELASLLIDGGANFYICGSAAMARDVSNAAMSAITDSRNWTEPEVQAFMDRQKRCKRWHQDVWG